MKTNKFLKMDECVSNQQLLLPENYIVQPVESIPISMIDYEKMEMAHLIQTGQFTNGVIQIADVNSNLKTKELHPLEAEIQRDLELRQQQEAAAAKRQTSSVIQPAPQLVPEFVNKGKCLEAANPMFDGVMQLQAISGRESVVNVNQPKPQEGSLCHVSSSNGPVVLEKRQFIIVSDNSVLLNITPKEEVESSVDKIDESIIKEETIPENTSVDLDNEILDDIKMAPDSDSENEGDDIEPVNDYEPDPDPPETENTESHRDQKEKPNKCYVCFKSYRQKKNMYAHIRKVHSTQPKIEGGILCPLCKMHALRQEHLRNHLEVLHDIHIEKEEKLFSTMEEFLCWKEHIQRETLSFYVSKSSSKLLANNQQKTYYKCHRSGNYVTLKKENRKKKLKVQGSNKIGATCPAAIEVTENIHGINVTFWKTHVGHENDLAHLVLSREEKARIMDFFASGLAWDKILEIVKKDGSKGSGTPSRLNAISKQDLRNIKKIHEVKSNPEIFPSRKKLQGRKPVKERMLRRASQSLVIEKAETLLKLLETTEVRPEFRPKVCLMMDNLISTIKRRAVKSSKKESTQRRSCTRQSSTDKADEKEQTGCQPGAEVNSGSQETYGEHMETPRESEKSFHQQLSAIRVSRRNPVREVIKRKLYH